MQLAEVTLIFVFHFENAQLAAVSSGDLGRFTLHIHSAYDAPNLYS